MRVLSGLFFALQLAVPQNAPRVTPPCGYPSGTQILAQNSKPMDEPTWTDIAQTALSGLTAFLTLVGFVLVVRQLKHSQQTLAGSTHATLYGQQQAITEIFIQCPELREYFYSGKVCTPHDPLRLKVAAAADLMADFFEHISFQWENLPPRIRPAWTRFIHDVCAHSPVMQAHFTNHAAWYDERFVAEFCIPVPSIGDEVSLSHGRQE